MSDQINIWIIDRKGVITQEPIVVSKAGITRTCGGDPHTRTYCRL